ncbi:MAG TPA: FtsX-like permease family protein [bacterium]|nr:FtsX-like permease family protein [bacterium]
MRFFIEAFEGFRIAMGALGANKLRAFLTLLGIIVGVSTVIGIISLTDGLDVAFGEQISALGSDVLYINKYPWVGRESWEAYRNRKDITMDEVDALKKFGTLFEAVSPTVQTRRTVKYRNRSLENVTIVGTDDSRTSGVYPQFGRDLNPLDVANRRQVCVIGYDVAEKLFTDTDPIGKYLKISGRNYLVIGVMEKQGDVFGQTLDQEAKIPIGAFFKMYGRNRNISIQVKVKDPLLMEEARDEIRGILRRVRTVPPGEEDDFAINQMDMIMRMYQSLTGGLYAAAVGVGAISLLVGGIGIMNIMLVSVTERTREIGIRKAIGAKRRNLLWQFLIESVMISLIGGVIGIAAGFGLGKLVASVSPLPAAVSPLAVLLGMGFSSAVGIFFGIYPASKAARLDPIVALRHE